MIAKWALICFWTEVGFGFGLRLNEVFPVAKAAVCSKAVFVVELLFVDTPIVCWGSEFGLCFTVIQYFVSVLFCNHLDGEEIPGCFAIIVSLMSCDSQCSVALPHGAVGWSAVFDWCIF